MRGYASSPHYLKNIRVHRNSVMYRGAMLNIHKYRLRASSCPDIYRNSMTTIAKENEEKWYADILDLLKDMVDFSMFLEWHFLLMSVATILLFTWFIVPYFYLAELMVRNGYTEQEASTLLSIIGFTNFLGMIFLGWAGDQPWMNVTKTYSVNLVLCGITTLAMPLFVLNYWMLVVTVALFGLFFASNFSFTPPILVELIPLERFTTAYGLILMCQGIGNLLGPPLGGLMFDITLAWDLSFYMAGIWIIVAGVLVAVIPATKNRVLWGSGSLQMDIERDKTSNA